MKLKMNRLLWTFGNHEPIPMYRRVGRRSTGGVQGNARWLEKWHHDFDSPENMRRIADLGMNIFHCHFYKGMGWEYEKRDLPGLRTMLQAAHENGITVLAYVQFGTLYPEIMKREIPNLEEWAARRHDGAIRLYERDDFRWVPCPRNPDFKEYLKKIVRYAVEEGFDGLMFDNIPAQQCYCPRCQQAFREWIAGCHFDFLDPEFVSLPMPDFDKGEYFRGEVEDPAVQEMIRFGYDGRARILRELCDHAHALKKDFLCTGNWHVLMRGATNTCGVFEMLDVLDLVVDQSGDQPRILDGAVISQIPSLKMAHGLAVSSFPLTDAAADVQEDPAGYLCGLYENLFGGSISVDRTILSPQRGGLPNKARQEARRPLLKKLKEYAVRFEDLIQAESYEPVGLLYARDSIVFSEKSHHAFLRAMTSLLRGGVPFRILCAGASGFLRPDWDRCETIIMPEARCLSDKLVELLRVFPGKLAAAGGPSGDYDENYAMREANPFDGLPILPVTAHEIVSEGWTLQIRHRVDDWGTRFAAGASWDGAVEGHSEYKLKNGKIAGILLTSPCSCKETSLKLSADLDAGGYIAEDAEGKTAELHREDGLWRIPPFTGMLLIHNAGKE